MTRMIRKQVYIEPEQDELLKQRSAELGVTEAELIRRCLDTSLHNVEGQTTDPRAWDEVEAFIEKYRMMDVPQTGRAWTRDELYDDDERFKRFSD